MINVPVLIDLIPQSVVKFDFTAKDGKKIEAVQVKGVCHYTDMNGNQDFNKIKINFPKNSDIKVLNETVGKLTRFKVYCGFADDGRCSSVTKDSESITVLE